MKQQSIHTVQGNAVHLTEKAMTMAVSPKYGKVVFSVEALEIGLGFETGLKTTF